MSSPKKKVTFREEALPEEPCGRNPRLPAPHLPQDRGHEVRATLGRALRGSSPAGSCPRVAHQRIQHQGLWGQENVRRGRQRDHCPHSVQLRPCPDPGSPRRRPECGQEAGGPPQPGVGREVRLRGQPALGAQHLQGAVPLPLQDQVSVADSYLYDDGCEPCGNDTFSREPFVVKFVAPHTEVKELVLVPLHTPPSDAVAEIDALYDVYLDVIDKWGTHDVLFLGDFNADCAYVRPEDWPHIRLRTHSSFQWLTPDTADTTVATTTDCAYDRIVAAGPKLRGAAVPGTARVYDFQKAFGLSYKEASAVSDHFPVEVTLKSL